MPAPALPEIVEAEARGSVAATYAAIRRVLGVEMVVLYYRVLAAEPGRVERVWAALEPNLASVAGRAAAAGLAPHGFALAAPLDARSLREGGLDVVAAPATVEAFDRANRLNLVALSALLHGAPGDPVADRAPAPALDPIPTLPLPALAALPPDARALLERISVPLAGPERPILVPSMLRVFAHDRALLAALWRSVGPPVESGDLAAAVDDLVVQARSAAERLPYPVAREADDETRGITARFVRTIPAMIVVCDLVRAALGEQVR